MVTADDNNQNSLGKIDGLQVKPIIKADHVRMIFNMASEQLHSLKEYFIKLAKHELHFKEFVVLDDISFEIYPGEVYGLVGTNGSGKSTMLKIIAGVLEPSSGTIEARGVIAPLIELGAGFDMELTARENIFLNGALLGYSKKYIQEHFNDIVEFAEIEDFLEMPLKNYSSGMIARIAFSIATVIVPDILIVDEALSVGDQFFQAKCEQRIKELIKDHNVTVLFVSHSIAQVRRICERVIWIEQGSMKMIGPAKKVCDLYSYRMEDIQIILTEKDEPVPSDLLPSTLPASRITYGVSLSEEGWQSNVSEGENAGTSNDEERHGIEAIHIALINPSYPGDIIYNASSQDKGWWHDKNDENAWPRNEEIVGEALRRMGQIQIKLTGELAEHYDIHYRVFSTGYEWMDWKKNGEIAGVAPFTSTLKRERTRERHRRHEKALDR